MYIVNCNVSVAEPNEPGSFVWLSAVSQMLKRWGLQQRKCLFTKQPSKEIEKQLKYASLKAKGSGYLWDKAEVWGAWGNVIENKKKVRQPLLCAYAPKP